MFWNFLVTFNVRSRADPIVGRVNNTFVLKSLEPLQIDP